MRDRLTELIPEITLFSDDDLKEKTIVAYENALNEGGWNPDDLTRMPFTLLIDPCPASMLDHIRGVTQVSLAVAEALKKAHPGNEKMHADHNLLLAGALLHDVGKLVEYMEIDGKFVKSESGKLLRHPVSGAAIAKVAGLPDKVQHMIAYHSHEGDKARNFLEAFIVNHSDFLNFEPLKV